MTPASARPDPGFRAHARDVETVVDAPGPAPGQPPFHARERGERGVGIAHDGAQERIEHHVDRALVPVLGAVIVVLGLHQDRQGPDGGRNGRAPEGRDRVMQMHDVGGLGRQEGAEPPDRGRVERSRCAELDNAVHVMIARMIAPGIICRNHHRAGQPRLQRQRQFQRNGLRICDADEV
jgi:hypothetical protein